MSDTNRVALRAAQETVLGTLEVGAYTDIPFTGSSDLGATPETVTSEVIRSDRQVTDLVKVNESIGGGFDSELIPTAFDLFLPGIMQSAAATSSGATLDADSSVSGSDVTGGAGDFTSVAVGDFVRITGTVSGATNTSVFRVGAKAGDVLTLEGNVPTYTGTVLVESGDKWENGTTPTSFSFERQFLDHAAVTSEYMNGCQIDTFSISASSSAIVNCSFGVLGMGHIVQDGRLGGLSTTSAPDDGPFNSSSNVATLGVGGSELTVVTDLSLEIANNLRERNALGTVGAISIGSGEFNVTGSLSVYFEDKTLLDQLLNNTATRLSFGFTAADGKSIVFDLPAIKFSEGVPDISGKNSDVMLALSFQAFRDATVTKTMRIFVFN